MLKSILPGSAAFLAVSFITMPIATANTVDGAPVILAQGGEPGPPVGGPTGAGGNGGVGNHDAGTERSQSYDSTPSGDSSSRGSKNVHQMNGDSNSLNSTTSGGHTKHHHQSSTESGTNY